MAAGLITVTADVDGINETESEASYLQVLEAHK